MAAGEVCQAGEEFDSRDRESVVLSCQLPARSASEAADFLETVGSSGGLLGTGSQTLSLGVNAPVIRAEYERQVNALIREVDRRRKLGKSAREISEWVVRERAIIARRVRLREGFVSTVVWEVRDWKKYGAGGRTYENMERHYARKGLHGNARYERMVGGATTPNMEVSQAAVKGAKFLKYGGRVVIVISLASTAYTILTAPRDELERVIYREAGAFAGGSAGAGLAVGACLVFGVATGGWGLLACGIIGGVGGGVGGAKIGEGLYYSMGAGAEEGDAATGVIDAQLLSPTMPQLMHEHDLGGQMAPPIGPPPRQTISPSMAAATAEQREEQITESIWVSLQREARRKQIGWWPQPRGLPYAREPYCGELTNGSSQGRLNGAGEAVHGRMPVGQCSFTFQDFYVDIDAWFAEKVK